MQADIRLRGVQLFFRFDLSQRIGLGHYSRCSALAEVARSFGAEVHFIVRAFPAARATLTDAPLHRVLWLTTTADDVEPENYTAWMPKGCVLDARETRIAIDGQRRGLAQALILDHYAATQAWVEHVGASLQHLTVLEDFPTGRKADLRVSFFAEPAPAAAGLQEPVAVLEGPTYLPLRPEFATAAKVRPPEPADVTDVAINFGAMDPLHLLPVVARQVCDALPDGRVHLIVSSFASHLDELRRLANDPRMILHVAPKHLAALLSSCQLAVGGAGVAAWERAAIGLPCIIVPFEPDQALSAQMLHQKTGCPMLPLDQLDQLPEVIKVLASDRETRDQMSASGRRASPGDGGERILSAIGAALAIHEYEE